MPGVLGASGSVRQTATPQSATRAPEVQTLCPLRTQPSPSRDRPGADRREVGAGLGLGEQLAGHAVGAQHRPGSSVAAAPGCPRCAMVGATSCWVTGKISVRRGTSKAASSAGSSCVGRRQVAAAELGPARSGRPSRRRTGPAPSRGSGRCARAPARPSSSRRRRPSRRRSPQAHRPGAGLGDAAPATLRASATEGRRASGRRSSSGRQHRAGADARRAVDVGEAEPRRAGDLSLAGLAPQLRYDLVDLAEPGRADRLAVGDAAAVGVDRQPAADLGRAGGDPASPARRARRSRTRPGA